jgi:hypothetical protein
LRTTGGDLSSSLPALLLQDIAENQTRAMARTSHRDGAPDTARGTRDDDGATGKHCG